MRKFVLGLILAVAISTVLPATAQADTVSDEATFVAKINALRASKGLGSLQVDPVLVAKARLWAAGMAAAGKIWHSTLSDGVTEDWKKLGENVGMGGSVDGLHDAFVASPHHYENLVDPAFGYVGIGVVKSGSTLYVSEVFMQLMGTKTPVAPAPTTVTVPRPTTTTAPRPTTTTTRPPAPPKPAVVKAPAAPTTTTTAPPAAAPVDPPAAASAAADAPRAPSALLVSVLERLRTFDS